MSEFGNAYESFEERQSKKVNIAEERFKEWAARSQVQVFRLGFDEKHERLPQQHYNLLPEILRKLPDFVAIRNGARIVEIKGSFNFKRVDYECIDRRVEWFSSPSAPLWFVFCVGDSVPVWRTPAQIKEAYELEEDKTWNDGVIYRTLKLK